MTFNQKEYNKKYYQENKEKRKEYLKKWYQENKEKRKEHCREYNKYLEEKYPEKYKEGLKRRRERSINYKIKNPNYNKEWYQSYQGRYSRYKRNARERKKEFTLTFEEFMTFWQKPCDYCGNKIETIGLDRVDSRKGYSIDNVVPCCRCCNIMKWELSREEFIEKIIDLAKRLKKKYL